MNKEDFVIWERIKEDDDAALKVLFDRYYKPLCIYALQFSKSLPDAEDFVQGVFITLWSKRNEIHIQTSLKAYLYRSVFNTCMQNKRKEKKIEKSLELLKWEILQEQVEEDSTLLPQRIERIKCLVDALPDRCKEILLLSKREGYKNKEIAEKLGISLKTVESQMSIAFKKIRLGFKKANLVLLVFLGKRTL
ncbi:RNA polymerase sigma factor [Pareuzebyella sediminis]|uniref:RNA polymerase sigma factor n=1 Tax=Pareuzebyella sediminis TaxID=2607998 RepID=UPI0011EBDDAC|nr:RNA polymerase sigma-70 factor [Pareuzebyella sediminis]